MINKLRKTVSVILALIMVFCIICSVYATSKHQVVKVLFTHDLHSRMDSDILNGEEVGGFARIKTLIDQKFDKTQASVLVDAGDFSMGTLYQTVFETHASELTMLGYLGYDATTFGNHEFDYRSVGVANMFEAALKNSDAYDDLTLPEFIISNIDWEKNNSEDNLLVKNALEAYGAKEYTIIERGGVRFGIFAVMGQDAEECAPASGIDFDDIVENSQKMVNILKNEENVDIIICLSHSGTDADES